MKSAINEATPVIVTNVSTGATCAVKLWADWIFSELASLRLTLGPGYHLCVMYADWQGDT